MKRMSMMLQWALILFCVMAIPSAILTWYSGAQMQMYSEEAIAETALSGLDANRGLSEMAMETISRDVVRLASTFSFNRLRRAGNYEQLNQDYDNVASALSLARELQNMHRNMSGVHSLFFYLDGADYVVSSDLGVVKLDGDYERVDWLNDALSGHVGIGGVWYPRVMASGQNVISFALPLTRLTTSARGTIVVNLLESQLYSYLSAAEPGERASMIIGADGLVVSATDKALLLTSGRELLGISEILDSGDDSGYVFLHNGVEWMLYTWQRVEAGGWTYVSARSTDVMMAGTNAVRRNIALLTALILLLGIGTAAFLSTWLSRPARELARSVRERGNLAASDQNEMVFLQAAFEQMQREEGRLSEMLNQRQQDARDLAVHSLLDGELLNEKDRALLSEMLPWDNYLVAMVALDQNAQYMSDTMPETRSYHRYLFMSQSEARFSAGMRARCAYRGQGNIAVVVSFDAEVLESGCGAVRAALLEIQQAAPAVFGHTVTIGVSGVAKGSARLHECVAEAMEATKRRIIAGGDSLFTHTPDSEAAKRYLYPTGNERRILNYLSAGDMESIAGELRAIREQILAAEGINYDNILFIYNQLVAASVRQLGENNISTTRLFLQRGNVYGDIAALDTLPELEAYLTGFFEEIIQYTARKEGAEAPEHGERVLRYLSEHYREELNFEQVAELMGISYSHMRKCVRELTGKRLIDCLNQLRVQHACQLLVETDLSITQIALEVGYQNVQSFNRFFRKYEGMSAGEYRTAQGGLEADGKKDEGSDADE